ncbi:MAG: GGDEF domain-containing protein [Deltaproteobacteria bacterium]|nr:GGDEF domain-containing protein [Deltaproteobacteria bacterium]
MDQKQEIKTRCPLNIDECPVSDEIRRLQEECDRLRELSQIDALTGYFNYRYLLNALEGEMERTRRTALPTGLIMVDLDNFKQVNDHYGHETGNIALKWCTKIWRSKIRRIDVPCRYGGEEFAFILPGTPLPQTVQAAERLRSGLENETLEFEQHKIKLTASFGVEAYNGKGKMSVKAFIRRADRSLLEAKTGGRNRVCYEEIEHREPSTEITEKEREALYTRKNPAV